MKFKYMIRGMGIGVIITAAFMGAYSRQAVADARVAVLREYGFGEESRPDVDDPEPSTGSVVTPPDEESAVDGVVEIVIASGDDSGTVARKLYNAGLIENAAEYDAFLMQHGYDKRLSTGTKTINVTDSWQEIADKITR